MANAQCCFYCKQRVPVAIGYSVSEAFRTQVSRPSSELANGLEAQRPHKYMLRPSRGLAQGYILHLLILGHFYYIQKISCRV